MKTHPKKRFGQHFLRDTGTLNRIVQWIKPAPDNLLLDIGAGDGALSARLAPGVARLVAIEVDFDCLSQLENALAPFKDAAVVAGDILRLDLNGLVSSFMQPGQKLRVVGNLPYNIATAIVEKLLHSNLPIEDMAFMVQLEVAERITAKPGSRKYGFLSVDCQHRAEVQLGFKVSPACFVPRPKVYSSMVALRPKRAPLDPDYEWIFEMLAKAAFGHRRKTLANSLLKHPILGNVSSVLLSKAEIDGARRAEELTVEEYERMARVFQRSFHHKISREIH